MKNRRHRKRRRQLQLFFICTFTILVGFILVKWMLTEAFRKPDMKLDIKSNVKVQDDIDLPSWIDAQFIRVDGASRRGEALESVNDIVIHYVGNPGTTARQNHDYYNNPSSEVSSHFVVGLEGEIIQCIPLHEKSSASNWRNKDTISIEVCHPDDTGKFTDVTYNALVKLTAWLTDLYELDESHIIRHYDVTGKECPRYFVQHKDKWEQFKTDVTQAREK